ncbi:MAG: MATE family efflux transporter [Candidatus Zixiibacteriota bacterium]
MDKVSTPSEAPVPDTPTIAARKPIDPRHVYRAVLRTGLPSVIGYAATQLYSLTDMFWVSRLGPEPVAGLAIFGAFYWVISSVNQIAGAGSVAIIARRYGEKDIARTQTAIVEAFVLKFVTAAACAVVGYLLTPWIVRLLGAEGEITDHAVAYGRVMFLGLVFSFPCWTLFTSLRGIDHPRYAMVIMIVSMIFNAILDPFLIFGLAGLPKLGVAGAAWASNAGFALTVLVGLAMFFRGAFRIRLDWAAVRRMHVSTLGQMMRIGLPSGISSISFSLARMVVTPMIAHYGASYVAVYGAGSRVIELGIILAVGLELGLSPMIGHALGARDKLLAWVTARKAIGLGVIVMTAFGAVMAICASPLTRVFFSDPSFGEIGTVFFRVMALQLPFVGAFVLFEGTFMGAGNTVPTMVIGLIHAWVLQVPLIWLFSHVLGGGPQGVWWGYVASEGITAIVYGWWFSRKRWLHQEV